MREFDPNTPEGRIQILGLVNKVLEVAALPIPTYPDLDHAIIRMLGGGVRPLEGTPPTGPEVPPGDAAFGWFASAALGRPPR